MSEPISLLPDDPWNKSLVENVHPADWVNPNPAPMYNLVVIGGGTAGLVSAAGAAGLGAKVALVERHLLGGDCLNYGCVPSKGLIAAARAAAGVWTAGEFGVRLAGEAGFDFSAAMSRMRALRSSISRHDSAARFRELGVDVFLGRGQFADSRTIVVGEARLRFRRAVIATGARAAALSVPGSDRVGYLTNETLFSLTECPPRLAVIGGGPIGCEMAQSFARCGARVTLFETTDGILPREDSDAAAVVQEALVRDGVDVQLRSRVTSLESAGAGKVVRFEREGEPAQIECDEILVSIGRRPNLAGLELERAGVASDPRTGVIVDDRLRTTCKSIFAAGDVCSRFQFTHAADFLARIVLRNALFPFGRAKASRLLIPHATYTSPELAQVGLTERAARERGIEVQVFRQDFSGVDRAILDGETEGFVKVLVRAGTDRIVGASIVAAHAGELISQLTQAMQHGIGLGAIASVIHPYPTSAEAVRKLGDQYNRARLTPRVAGWFRWWLERQRGV